MLGTRAAGILDEIARQIGLGRPKEVAERIAYGDLDMRPEAIIERQEDLYPTTAFHGGGDDIRIVDPNRVTTGKTANTGFFMSSSPVNAASYADRAGNIMPLAVDTRGFDVVNAGYNDWNRITNPDYLLGGERLATFGELPGYRGTMEPDRGIFDLNVVRDFDTDELARTARRFGSPGLIVQNVSDVGPNYKAFDPAFEAMTGLRVGDEGYQEALDTFFTDTIVASDPTRVRSLFAAFDPEYKGSNILGDRAIPVAGAGLLAAAAMAPEDAEAGIITKSFGRNLDPRFDPRVYEQEKLMNNRYIIDDRGTVNPDRLALSSLEGRPIISTMSDRTQAGGLLTGINDVVFETPINLQGGQGFMFENPGMVWASAQNPVNQIMAAADLFPGETPLFAPWRMAPSGGDFATMTGETMLEYAKAAMTKSQKSDLDEFIKGFETKGSWDKKTQKYKNKGLKVDGWKGIDDPSSRETFRNLPDSVRKELMDRMDKLFRNKGGIGIGEARSAVLDPTQATALDGRIQNIGEIFTGSPIITESGHASYPMGVPGRGVGYTDQDVSIFELLPDARLGEEQKLVGDALRPTANELRALQMKPYYGRVTEDILRGLEARGVNVNANPIATAAAVSAGAELEGLLSQLPQKNEESYSYGDILPIKRALDPEAREGLLGGYSPAYTGILEDVVEGLLTFKTQAERGLYNPTAATDFLL